MSKTYDEMKSQYGALRETALYIRNRINVLNRFLEEKPVKTVAFLGCGSSFSVSKSLEAIYRNLSGNSAMSLAAGDLMLHTENYRIALEDSVIVAVTRSGSTSEVLRALEAIKAIASVRVIALTCVEGAPITELSDVTFNMPWAFDESVCQTRTVSNLYLAGAILAAGIAKNFEAIDAVEATVNELEAYAERIEPMFLQLAKEKWDHAVVLADGEIGGIAEEGALAFKEICQLNSNYYGLLDSRHGPMVMVGKTTLVFASLGAAGEQECRLVADVTKKYATVLTVSDEAKELPKTYANIAFGRPLDVIGRGLALIVVCQLAAYYKSLVRGVNPDAPTGLDAWIKL
ncbi:MAG: SIS domain-containing protein [Clostridia bacterium]|nr:SIS domain-containing protein [Clostridia bacterium]